jgi:hypothetical protein
VVWIFDDGIFLFANNSTVHPSKGRKLHPLPLIDTSNGGYLYSDLKFNELTGIIQVDYSNYKYFLRQLEE